MFICPGCARRLLSKLAKTWPFPESRGHCEICGKTRVCKDVYSGSDWAWKHTDPETKPKKKRK